jgi:hypothetical protein
MKRGKPLARNAPLARGAPLKRGKPMTRGKGLNRGASLVRASEPRRRLPARNKLRRAAAYLRNFGPEAIAVRAMPCAVANCECEYRPTEAGGSDPAHVVSVGAGGCRFDLIPLCMFHHAEQHRIGVGSFEALHRLDMRAMADTIAIGHASLGIIGLVGRWASDRDSLAAYELEALLGWLCRWSGGIVDSWTVPSLRRLLATGAGEAWGLCDLAELEVRS